VEDRVSQVGKPAEGGGLDVGLVDRTHDLTVI
jgi:hypothetical protein